MQKITVSGKAAARAAAAGSLLLVLGVASLSQEVGIGQPYQRVMIDGQLVGYTSGNVNVKETVCAARRELAAETDEKLCMDFDWNADTVRKPFVGLLRETELREAVKQSLKSKVISSGQRVYTVAIDDYRGNFRSLEEVNTFLNKVKDKKEGGEAYTTKIETEASHISGVMQAQLVGLSGTAENVSADSASEGKNATAGAAPEGKKASSGNPVSEEENAPAGGAAPAGGDMPAGDGGQAGTLFAGASALTGENMSAGDGGQAGTPYAGISGEIGMQLAAAASLTEETELSYRTGVLAMEFVERVEIYENYVPAEEIADIDREVVEVTKEKESNKIYVVESGDCLSVIALDNNTTVASIMALNGMEDADAIIRDGQELIIAVPEPDLKIRVTMGEVYEEDYTEEPVIIANDSWYTTREEVLEEGTTGHRERNDVVVYENDVEVSRTMVQQKVMMPSKAAVIERGTIIPPTYIKPISGGRFTSGFGRRWGRMHKGVDWACPTGTTVFASCGGTVIQASYNGGYGNNVVISHPDGRMTRYAHNSKLLVKTGQTVEQGEPIALSGNTGRSTGPHVHFEIYINGAAVNPLKYISN